MPVDWSNYPPDWRAISARIWGRSGGRCECTGECGLHKTHPGPRRCEEVNGQPARWAKGRVVLTVAHLDHDTTHNADDNLRAFCQRCHLRYDHALHMGHAAETRRRRKVERGQLELIA